MAKPRRKRRLVLWCSLAGLALTLVASVLSEFFAFSYREDTSGMVDRFLLWKSSVMMVYRTGSDDITRFGREAFEPGWTVIRPPRDLFRRTWLPGASVRSFGVGNEMWDADVPLWVPAVIFAAGVWYGRRGGWTGTGVCRACGYDVRGSVGRVCPECGATA